MKVCVPTQEDKGINSLAYGHFGSAPYFIIRDTDQGETKSIINNKHESTPCPWFLPSDDSLGRGIY
ncbi:MAG: NifB/NifX family molybdenum-iron cluster-binding protein [Candidatus Desulfaltia sp.]|nr:NifB/NifX family molybdenum-iron cluster-binding protein [Candidatus Desulfaltia sp.]